MGVGLIQYSPDWLGEPFSYTSLQSTAGLPYLFPNSKSGGGVNSGSGWSI